MAKKINKDDILIEKLKNTLKNSSGDRRVELVKEITDLYYQESKQFKKKILDIFSDVYYVINSINFRKEILKFNVDGKIDLYDFNAIINIKSNFDNRKKLKEEREEYLRVETNKFLKKLDNLTGLSFYGNKSYGIYVTLEETHHSYKRLEIDKKHDYLKFHLIDEYDIFGFPPMMGGMSMGWGMGWGCDIEEVLEEDSNIEILEEEETKPIRFDLLEDLETEGPIYKFILDNIDITYETLNIPEYWDYTNVIYKKYHDKFESILKEIEIGKIFEIPIDSRVINGYMYNNPTNIYIKKINDDTYRIYKKVDGEIIIVESNKKNSYYTLCGVVSELTRI